MILLYALIRDVCHSDACLENYPKNLIPLGLMFFAVSGGIAMPMFYRAHDAWASLLGIIITYSIMLSSALILKLDSYDVMSICFVGLLIFFSLAIHEGTLLTNYTSYSKFETALREQMASENKEYLMKIQTEEMRHMIGNISIV